MSGGTKVEVEHYVPKPRKEKKVAVCDSRCKKWCFYCSTSSGAWAVCMYADIEHHSRGCPAGKGCDKFLDRRKRKPNNDYLIQGLRREAWI